MAEQTLEQRTEIPKERTFENSQDSNPGTFIPSSIEWDMDKHISWNSKTTDWEEVRAKAAAVARRR